MFTFSHMYFICMSQRLQNNLIPLLTYTGTQALLFGVVLYMLFIHTLTSGNKNHCLQQQQRSP